MFQVNPLLKNQALFSLKDKSKKLKMLSAAISVWHFQGCADAKYGVICQIEIRCLFLVFFFYFDCTANNDSQTDSLFMFLTYQGSITFKSCISKMTKMLILFYLFCIWFSLVAIYAPLCTAQFSKF